MRLRVKRDRVTGLLVCPICYGRDDAPYFYTVEDLLRHLLTHVKRERMELIQVRIEEGEEGAKLEEVGEE